MKITLLHIPTLLWFALLASAYSLAFAFVSEYGFGLKPCELCIFQRIPYALVIPLALLGLWKKKWAVGLCVVIALLFLIDSGIGTYHAGVEQHWFPGPEACTDAPSAAPLTLEQIMEKIKNAPLVACDQPQWDVYGITMAAMNAVWALMLAVCMFIALHIIRKKAHRNA
jgi:disulfide bond formation protein DsbB